MKNPIKYSLGTFTYREKPRAGVKVAAFLIANALFFTAVFGVVNTVYPIAHADAPAAKLDAPTLNLPNDPEHIQIENYIKQVFGSDAHTAFRLLTDPRCHENGNLDPKIVNDNTKWGGRGRDIGVFQINDSWQGVQDKFLFNWRVNVQIAYQLFIENHKHFNLWTCGKALGI